MRVASKFGKVYNHKLIDVGLYLAIRFRLKTLYRFGNPGRCFQYAGFARSDIQQLV